MGSNLEYDLASMYFKDGFTELFIEGQEIVCQSMNICHLYWGRDVSIWESNCEHGLVKC